MCYCDIVDYISDVMVFMVVVGVMVEIVYDLGKVDFYISYEVLFLEYEEVLVCIDSIIGLLVVGLGYMIWIGDRMC